MGGEVDLGGGRKRALDAFLEARVAEGYRVETHEDTHAIIVEGGGWSWRRLLPGGRRRFVVQVDDRGSVTMSAAEPLRH